MPAPTLKDFLAFEFALETAWKTVLDAVDATLNAQVEFSDGEIKYPLTTLQLRGAKRTTHKHRYNGKDYWDEWSGLFVFGFETVRGENSDQQATMIGSVRTIAQEAPALIDRNVAPWHVFSLFTENSMSRGVDPETRIDRSELAFDARWSIRTDAWDALVV